MSQSGLQNVTLPMTKRHTFLKLIAVRKGSPLSFNERVIYSMLLYRGGQSCQRLATVLGLSWRAVSRNLRQLAGHGLAKHQGRRWHAQQPAADLGLVTQPD